MYNPYLLPAIIFACKNLYSSVALVEVDHTADLVYLSTKSSNSYSISNMSPQELQFTEFDETDTNL